MLSNQFTFTVITIGSGSTPSSSVMRVLGVDGWVVFQQNWRNIEIFRGLFGTIFRIVQVKQVANVTEKSGCYSRWLDSVSVEKEEIFWSSIQTFSVNFLMILIRLNIEVIYRFFSGVRIFWPSIVAWLTSNLSLRSSTFLCMSTMTELRKLISRWDIS